MWCVHPFVCDEQSAVASVSSDGSMRCAFTSTSELAHRSKMSDTSHANSLDQWTLEDFRINNLEYLRQNVNEINQSKGTDFHVNDVKLKLTENVVVVTVSTGTVNIESNLIKIPSPNHALHAIDSTSIKLHKDYEQNSPFSSSSRLFAYGGASGLLRIHSLDLLKEIVKF